MYVVFTLNSNPLTPVDFKTQFSAHLGGSVGLVTNFSSGHDLTVREFEPYMGLSAVSTEPTSDPLSHRPLSAPPLIALSVSQK